MRRTAIERPSGENDGSKSYALFAAVSAAGFAPPAAGTRNTSVFVDHAVALPPWRATNAIVLPSGEIETSSMPPKGSGGESVAWPGVRSTTASGLSGDQTKRCEYLPSSH